ncbi:MAG: Uma2 family endonuclease [Acidobacteriaceae bacterium]|nr:Uma2 family endonuclease [Acidobacteriaceae bacterium]
MATTLIVPMTIEEFSRLPRGTERHELNAGELITMPPPKSLHALVALTVLELLQTYLQQHAIGRAIPEAGYVLSRDPVTIRQPDVSVISKEKIQTTGPDDYFEGAPELAVEVVSPSDSAEDLETKIEQYLQAGARQVWILYPKTKRVHVFYGTDQRIVRDESQTLEGGELLPGFSVNVTALFVQ